MSKKPPARAKKYEAPPKPEETGAYRVDLTLSNDRAGTYRDAQIYIPKATSSKDALEQATSTIHPNFSIVKAGIVFLGIVGFVILLSSISFRF